MRNVIKQGTVHSVGCHVQLSAAALELQPVGALRPTKVPLPPAVAPHSWQLELLWGHS